ncbi:hypothetical protein BDL97_04G125200 [Sphagnum fallax]|nr:hypothetical protein BDL97_04G125200 [Sphagnum fallax]KAH8965589.1 hypothetical protein BDL97_04G125200 [Sphagnum fallax]KAH8965590.1 hypothetical protein BDL97_04G125200 [Sphagnum fallax]
MWGNPVPQSFLFLLLLLLSCLNPAMGQQQLMCGRASEESLRELMMDPESQNNVSDNESCTSGVRAKVTRPHTVSITEFGAVGDGKFLNTHAFENAIFYLRTFADKGGAQLYIPPGQWLTGSISLISHLTLYLDRGATILASQDPKTFPVIDGLPSYGRGCELPGGRHSSVIHGENLADIVITGENGTIDGQGWVWWDMVHNRTLDYTRGHLVELINSTNILISNLTFVNSPFWTIHPVYCSNLTIRNLTIWAPGDSPNTDGIVPDSCTNVCIEDCSISSGGDALSIKSGWDEYGMAYKRPSSNIWIRRVVSSAPSGAGFAIGSEMSGGVSNIKVEDVVILNTKSGIQIKTTAGRGGYIVNVSISTIEMHYTEKAIVFTGFSGKHPDDNWDRKAYPLVEQIWIKNVVGENIMQAGELLGLQEAPFRDICLINIALDVISGWPYWNCSEVVGSSSYVLPKPCPELQDSVLSSSKR